TQSAYVTDSYAAGTVSCYDIVGGLAGYNYMSLVENSYSTGTVTTSMSGGGLIGGQDGGYVYNSYWNTETSGQSTSAGGTARSTADMTYPQSDSTYVGWDFSTPDWVIASGVNSGYPYLVWQAMGGLSAPGNITTSVSGSDLTITWDAVPGASSYNVYSSADPYGTYSLDGTGTFNGEEWTAPLPASKMFYYVTATDAKDLIKKK
ncbi:MAG: GLUG motif-containing protein, partial [Candidatus Delongbacteria bacterium]